MTGAGPLSGSDAFGRGDLGRGDLEPAGQVAERALAAGHGDECVVVVEDGAEIEVRFANNQPTSNGRRRVRRVTVAVFHRGAAGRSVGVVSRGGAVDVDDLVASARADAAAASPADDAAPLVDGDVDRDFDDPPPGTGPEVLQGVIGELGEAFAMARSSGHVLAGFAEHAMSTVTVASSTGLRRRHVQPTGRIQVVARAGDGSASAWVGRGTRNFDDVSLHGLHREAADRLGWSARRVDLPAGHYDTVLPPDAVADLVCMLGDAVGGRDAEDGQSVLSAPGGGTRLGEQLFALPFELRSDPAEAGLACCPFVVATASARDVSVFDDGMPLSRTAWVEAGRLARLRYHRAAAARSGVQPAGPIDNLVLELPGAAGSVGDLVAGVERGLLLTCLWYIREVDPTTLLLTGLTRDGVYLVERGEVVGAANNFRFNESPVDVLARAGVAGSTQLALSREWNEWFPRTAMPPLRVPDFSMSSVSPAT